MNPQDKLNVQHHGRQAARLLEDVAVNLLKSGSPVLADQVAVVRLLKAAVVAEVQSHG